MTPPVGEVFVRIKIHGPLGSASLEQVLVDTGAIHTMLDQVLAADLGIRPEGRGEFTIIGGTTVLPLGMAVVEIEGKSFRVPVILGDQNLVGLTTLETLGFGVDPVERRLVPRPGVLFPAAAEPAVRRLVAA